MVIFLARLMPIQTESPEPNPALLSRVGLGLGWAELGWAGQGRYQMP